MAKSPKIPMTISLPKELYDAIDRLSKLQNSSKSGLIISYLEPSLPVIKDMANFIEHLQTASPEERAKLHEKMLKTEKDALEQLQKLSDSTGELND